MTALSYGTALRHLNEILSDFGTVRDELTANHGVEPVELSINAYLLEVV
ncbi:hypothetical protein [Nostoc sp.]